MTGVAFKLAKHEAGHALSAVLSGVEVGGVTLHLDRGYGLTLTRDGADPFVDAVIAMAGEVASPPLWRGADGHDITEATALIGANRLDEARDAARTLLAGHEVELARLAGELCRHRRISPERLAELLAEVEPDPADLRQARHESGHAVVAHQLRYRVAHATLRPSDCIETPHCCWDGRVDAPATETGAILWAGALAVGEHPTGGDLDALQRLGQHHVDGPGHRLAVKVLAENGPAVDLLARELARPGRDFTLFADEVADLLAAPTTAPPALVLTANTPGVSIEWV